MCDSECLVCSFGYNISAMTVSGLAYSRDVTCFVTANGNVLFLLIYILATSLSKFKKLETVNLAQGIVQATMGGLALGLISHPPNILTGSWVCKPLILASQFS